MEKESGLGLNLSDEGGVWQIDTADFSMVSGISELARGLTEEIVEQCVWGTSDVFARLRVDPSVSPELATESIQSITVNSRISVAEDFPAGRSKLMNRILRVLVELQLPGRFHRFLSGKDALLFHFSQDAYSDELILAEYEPGSHFIRLTMERGQDCRFNLESVSHVDVFCVGEYHEIPDRERKVRELFQSIHGACHNQDREFSEIPERKRLLFQHLKGSGLEDLMRIKFLWPGELIPEIMENKDNLFLNFLGKILFLFEDVAIIEAIRDGDEIHVKDGQREAFLDLSQGGKVLNVSFTRPREVKGMVEYVARMPNFQSWLSGRGGCFSGMRVFLIHHLTPEILGMVHGMDVLECPWLHVLFVKYQGLVPDSFLDSIGSLPADRFQFHALQQVRTEQSIEGEYRLSDQYSPISKLNALDTELKRGNRDFFAAMKLTAGHLFFRDAIGAVNNGEQIVLIEDGGYLAPLINRMCLEGRTVAHALKRFGVISGKTLPELTLNELEMPLKEWLAPIYAGSVEHTRNGYDRLEEIQGDFGELAFPAATIAVSDLKRGEEAEATSTSIVHAIETILHGLGRMLRYRNVLVLGAKGAIGSNLVREFENRTTEGWVAGVDIVLKAPVELTSGGKLAPDVGQLPEGLLLDLDLIVGVVGKSVLSREFIETLVLKGKRPALYFASGSTKTVEFSALSDWIRQLRKAPVPRVGGIPVSISGASIRDPQTGVSQGIRYRFKFLEKSADSALETKDVYLFASGMPVNFLYYGVPSEMFDLVLTQLVQLSCWLVNQFRNGEALPHRLLALDGEISLSELE